MLLSLENGFGWQAEKIAARMISEDRMRGSIDQVSFVSVTYLRVTSFDMEICYLTFRT